MQNAYFSTLEPHIETWVHTAHDIGEGNALIDSILEEGNRSVSSIVLDPDS